MLTDRALLWEYSGVDRQVRSLFEPAREIMCCWTNTDTEDSSTASVEVDEYVVPGSRVWLAPDPTYSALEQWLGVGSSGDDDSVMEVESCVSTSDLRGREQVFSLKLNFAEDNPIGG